MRKVKILLVDDHQLVLEGLKLILEPNASFDIIGEAYDGRQALELLNNELVDVVVLDINMPKMDGISCARIIKSKFPSVKVIMLTMYSQKSFIEEIITIGIDGCLLKSNTGSELAEAIKRVYGGYSYYDQIQSFEGTNENIEKHRLSERELDIIRLLAEGLSSNEISHRLFISIHTVKTHRRNILRKLHLHNSAELVQFAINQGII